MIGGRRLSCILPIRRGRHPLTFLEAGRKIILVRIAAFFTDFTQCKGGILKILAGGLNTRGGDRVTDADFHGFLEERTQICRTDIGETGNIMQAEFVILVVIPDIPKNLFAQLVMVGFEGNIQFPACQIADFGQPGEKFFVGIK